MSDSHSQSIEIWIPEKVDLWEAMAVLGKWAVDFLHGYEGDDEHGELRLTTTDGISIHRSSWPDARAALRKRNSTPKAAYMTYRRLDRQSFESIYVNMNVWFPETTTSNLDLKVMSPDRLPAVDFGPSIEAEVARLARTKKWADVRYELNTIETRVTDLGPAKESSPRFVARPVSVEAENIPSPWYRKRWVIAVGSIVGAGLALPFLVNLASAIVSSLLGL